MKSKHGFVTTEQRSELMARIRGTSTTPEIALRKLLWHQGLRYRINVKSMPGKPDIVFRKCKLAIFVDGEFWHGYNWKTKKSRIKSNRDYWIRKIEGNIARDKRNNTVLKKEGFTVLRFWEHEIKNRPNHCVAKILARLAAICPQRNVKPE